MIKLLCLIFVAAQALAEVTVEVTYIDHTVDPPKEYEVPAKLVRPPGSSQPKLQFTVTFPPTRPRWLGGKPRVENIELPVRDSEAAIFFENMKSPLGLITMEDNYDRGTKAGKLKKLSFRVQANPLFRTVKGDTYTVETEVGAGSEPLKFEERTIPFPQYKVTDASPGDIVGSIENNRLLGVQRKDSLIEPMYYVGMRSDGKFLCAPASQFHSFSDGLNRTVRKYDLDQAKLTVLEPERVRLPKDLAMFDRWVSNVVNRKKTASFESHFPTVETLPVDKEAMKKYWDQFDDHALVTSLQKKSTQLPPETPWARKAFSRWTPTCEGDYSSFQ